MIQKAAIVMTACLGIACMVISFILKMSQQQEPKKEQFKFETLQLDTSALGTITLLGDGFVVGNTRGELRIFPNITPGIEPNIYQISTYAISAPVLEKNGVFYVGDENGRFWSFDPEKGVKWFYKTKNQITGQAIWCDDMVLVGSHSQSFYAFDPETGELKYSVECNGQINGTPLFLEPEQTAIFGSCDGILRKIDVHTGNIVAQIDFESMIPDTPAIYDDQIYVLTNNGDLAAVNPASFELIYRVSTKNEYFSSPYVTENFLFLTDISGKIKVHSRKDGAWLTTLEAEEKMTTLQSGNDSRVFAISRNGKLYEWQRENDQWNRKMLADFQMDCRRGCLKIRDKLLVADETGLLFYYKILP